MNTNKENLKKAVLWEEAEDKKVQCKLCNWRCLIADGKTGKCFVRQNINGVLYSLNYDKVCAANADPIEKKPLFHFQPGSSSFSIACEGCNFRCEFCQNWHIS
jgi:pyruvate formate lyase activating enzyme